MENKNILVFSPHADDAAIFIGGTLAKLSRDGWKIYIARVTNDDFDSKGLDQKTTIEKNRSEAEAAYAALGAVETIHMGFKSDYMRMNDYNKLRGDIAELIRKIRPYSLYTFDLDMRGESNLDHKIIAEAVHEALWISAFDLHYPEHFEKGLTTYSVPELVLFSTAPDECYTANDIESVMDVKIKALCCHETPINNMLMNAIQSAEYAGLPCDELKEILDAPRDEVIAMFATKLAAGIGEPFGLNAAEMIKVCPSSLGIFG